VTLPCIRCGRELKSAVLPDDGNQPRAGTVFTTHGHYGSTVFDETDGSFLEIPVCDLCVLTATGEGRVLLGTRVQVQRPRPSMAAWDGWGQAWCGHCGSAVITAEHLWHDDGTKNVGSEA
jgi:hypothetical protein